MSKFINFTVVTNLIMMVLALTGLAIGNITLFYTAVGLGVALMLSGTIVSHQSKKKEVSIISDN